MMATISSFRLNLLHVRQHLARKFVVQLLHNNPMFGRKVLIRGDGILVEMTSLARRRDADNIETAVSRHSVFVFDLVVKVLVKFAYHFFNVLFKINTNWFLIIIYLKRYCIKNIIQNIRKYDII